MDAGIAHAYASRRGATRDTSIAATQITRIGHRRRHALGSELRHGTSKQAAAAAAALRAYHHYVAAHGNQ
jgi:hypothetical protein